MTRQDDVPVISWKTLGGYASAIWNLTRGDAPTLPAAAFKRIAASDWSDLPDSQRFPVEGATLNYRCYGSPDSTRSLVLIHGSGCFGDTMHELAVRLARRGGARIYTLDMRGHGLSSGARGHAVHRPAQLCDDIAAFLKYLQVLAPESPICLGGHSAGGGLVLAFARSRHQHLAASFVFLAPYLGLGSNVNRAHFGGWVCLSRAKLAAITVANLFGLTRFNNASVVTFAADRSGDDRYIPSWSFNTLLAFGPGLWMPKSLPLPAHKRVLVLALDDDECFDSRRYREAFDSLTANSILPQLGPGGHWDLLVDAAAIQVLSDWLMEDIGAEEHSSTYCANRAA